MHTYPDSTTTRDAAETPDKHTGMVGADLFWFVGVGFLVGLALLAARGWLLVA